MIDFIAPHLLSSALDLPNGPDWLFEEKFDGMRLLVVSTADGVLLGTRSGLDWTHRFPLLVDALRRQLGGQRAVFDGELVAFGANGTADFKALCGHLGQRGAGLFYAAFDLLAVDGESLHQLPLTERKARLSAALPNGDAAAPIPFFDCGAELLRAVVARGGEGVVAKRRDSPYVPGARNQTWQKVKRSRRDGFVICGWAPDDLGAVRSVAMAERVDGELHYRGRVGAGLSQHERRQLADVLTRLDLPAGSTHDRPVGLPKSVRQVRPVITAEVRARSTGANSMLREAVILAVHISGQPIVAPRK